MELKKIIIYLIFFLLIFGSFFHQKGKDIAINKQRIVNYNQAIDDYWDDIKIYIDGTENLEACSMQSGSCYDLYADISGGKIEKLYFDNGGYLYFSADIDSDGSASDSDYSGNYWEFNLDTTSDVVNEAVHAWASENYFEIIE